MDATGGCWVSGVEFCYLLRGILNVIRIFPGVPFYSITFPFDQVLKSSPEHPAVQDFLHEVFFFAVNEFWRWWWGSVSAEDRVCGSQGQLNHIEDWVKSFH